MSSSRVTFSTPRSSYGVVKKKKKKKKPPAKAIPKDLIKDAVDSFRKMRLVTEIVRKTRVFVNIEFRMLTWSYVNFSLRVPSDTPITALIPQIYQRHGENILGLTMYVGKVSSRALVQTPQLTLQDFGVGIPQYDWTVDGYPDLELFSTVQASFPDLVERTKPEGSNEDFDGEINDEMDDDERDQLRKAIQGNMDDEDEGADADVENEDEDGENDQTNVHEDGQSKKSKLSELEELAALNETGSSVVSGRTGTSSSSSKKKEKPKPRGTGYGLKKKKKKKKKVVQDDYVMPEIKDRISEITCYLYYDFEVPELKSDPLLSFDITVQPAKESISQQYNLAQQLEYDNKDLLERSMTPIEGSRPSDPMESSNNNQQQDNQQQDNPENHKQESHESETDADAESHNQQQQQQQQHNNHHPQPSQSQQHNTIGSVRPSDVSTFANVNIQTNRRFKTSIG